MKGKIFCSTSLRAFTVLLALALSSAQLGLAWVDPKPPRGFGRNEGTSDIKIMVIDRAGRVKFTLDSWTIGDFAEGLAPFVDQKSHLLGYINVNGKVVIPAQFNEAGAFNEGLAAIKIGSKCSLIDKSGNIVVKGEANEFDSLSGMIEGLCLAQISSYSSHYIADEERTKRIKAELEKKGRAMRLLGLSAGMLDKTYGFIDKTGTFVIAPKFDDASPFAEGLAAICIGDKWGYIDKGGKTVIEPQFSLANSFSESFAAVKKNDKWGFIDRSGQLVVSPKYDEVRPFSDGLAAIQSDGMWGFVNTKGEEQIALNFPDIESDFQNGLASCAIDLSPIKSKNTTLIKIGNSIRGRGTKFSHDSESTTPFTLDRFFSPDLRYGLIDKKGQFVLKPELSLVQKCSENMRVIKSNGKFGYCDCAGKTVIAPKYGWAQAFSNGLAVVRTGDKNLASEKDENLEFQITRSVPALISDPALIAKDIDVCTEVLKIDPKNAQAFRDRAYLLCCSGKFQQALADFERLLAIVPRYTEGWNLKGEAELKLEKFKEAQADFTKAIELQPEFPSYYHRRGKARTGLKDYGGALADLTRAIELHKYPDYYLDRSIVYEALKKYDLAEKDAIEGGSTGYIDRVWYTPPATIAEWKMQYEQLYKKFLSQEAEEKQVPKYVRWRSGRAAAEALQGLIDALNDGQQFIEVKPYYEQKLTLHKRLTELVNQSNVEAVRKEYYDYAASLSGMGGLCWKVGDTDTAEKYFKQAIEVCVSKELKSLTAAIYSAYADFLGGTERAIEAEKYYKLSLDSTAVQPYYEDGFRRSYIAFLRKQGRNEDADAQQKELKDGRSYFGAGSSDYVSSYLPSAPTPPDNCSAQQYFDLSVTCKNKGLVNPAINYMEKAIETATDPDLKERAKKYRLCRLPKNQIPLNINAKHLHANHMESMDYIDKAEKYYREVIKEKPDFEYPYFCLSRVLRRQGKIDKARQLVDQVIKLNPNYFGGWMELGACELDAKHKSGAIDAFTKALSLDPNEESAKIELAKAKKLP